MGTSPISRPASIFKRSLTARLIALLTLCISATLLITTTVEYQFSRSKILLEVERDAQSRIDAAIHDLESRLSGIEETTQLFAEVLESQTFTALQLRELLREALAGRQDIFGAAIALEPGVNTSAGQGFAIYYHHKQHPAADSSQIEFINLADNYQYTERTWFSQPRQRAMPLWSEPYFDEGGGDILMATYSVPLYRISNNEREFLGIVTADVSLEMLQTYIDRIRLGKTGFGFLLSRDGRLMAAQKQENLMRPLLEVLPEDADRALWRTLITRTAQGQASTSIVACQEAGQNCIVKLAPLGDTHWPVGVYYSEYEMLAPLRDHLQKVLLSGAVTLIMLLVAVVWVSQRITRPLSALALASAEIATGKFDTQLPRVQREDELGRLVKGFSLMQHNLQHYLIELERETASRSRIEGELVTARAIQMSMLPQKGSALEFDSRFSLWASLRPAKSVGGDLYYYHLQDNRNLLLAVGDVSDKGVAAALFMSRAMTLLQQHAHSRSNPRQAMASLNRELAQGNDNCMFVTLFLGCLDLETFLLEFVSAGHTAPNLLRGGISRSISQQRGPALGLVSELDFELNSLQLQAGDKLAIFTDGIDEAFNSAGEQFGLERLRQLLEQHSGANLIDLGKAVIDAIENHASGTIQSDDIALLLLHLPGAATEFAVGGGELVSRVLSWVEQQANAFQVDRESHGELMLMAEEVVTNIEKYAGLDGQSKIRISMEKTADSGEFSQVWLQVCDAGIAFDPFTDSVRTSLDGTSESAAEGGLGVHLLEALSDWQYYQRRLGNNILRLGKRVHTR